MGHEDVRPGHAAADARTAGKICSCIRPSNRTAFRVVANHLHMIHRREAVGAVACRAADLHDISPARRLMRAVRQPPQGPAVRRVDRDRRRPSRRSTRRGRAEADSFLAAAKSSTQANSNTRAPACWAIRRVSSTEPVSTTTSSSTHGRMLASAAGSVPAASRTIMHSDRHTAICLVCGNSAAMASILLMTGRIIRPLKAHPDARRWR